MIIAAAGFITVRQRNPRQLPQSALWYTHISVTTDVYAHVQLRLQHETANRLSNVLRSGGEGESQTPSINVAARICH